MWHRQGRVSLTKGSDVVTGVGTNWVENIRVGDAFQGPDGKLYQVINVASNEALAISPAYEGATATNLNYWVVPIPGYSKIQADRLSLIISKLDGDIVTATEAADRAQAAAQQAQQWRNEAAVSAAAALQSKQSAALSADIAEQARDDAVAIVTGGTASIDPEAGKIPIAGAEASIKQAWIENLQFELDALRVAKNRLLYGDGPYPVLDFQFAGAKYLDPRIQFTRASVDWDENGREYGINEPVLTDKGLWVSGVRTNLMTDSSLLTQPATNADFVPAREVAKGVIRLGFLRESLGTTLPHHISTNNISRTLGESYRESFFVGKGSTRQVYVFSGSSIWGGNTAIRFDPITASITQPTNIKDPTVEDLGFAWRVSFTVSAVSNGTQGWRLYLHNGSSFNYDGDGESGAFLGSFQSEVGSAATPYIPTEGSQVTVATVTQANVETFGARTLVLDMEVVRSVFDNNTVYFFNWSTSRTTLIPVNGFMIWSSGSAGTIQLRLYKSGEFRSVSVPANWERLRKIAVTIQNNKACISVDGEYAEMLFDEDLVGFAKFVNVTPSTTNQSKLRWIKALSLYERAMTEQQLRDLAS